MVFYDERWDRVLKTVVKSVIILMMCLELILETVSFAAPSQFQEYQVKAAFIYNFANFVEWPAEAFPDKNSPIIVGILGENPVTEILNSVALEPINGRKVLPIAFGSYEEMESCHILFIDKSEQDNMRKIFARLKDMSILTVGDTEGFVQRGGIINFVEIDNQIRFEINVDAARKARLKISSKLLNLSRIISAQDKEVDQ